MKNQTTTIRKIVKQLNKDFWLPTPLSLIAQQPNKESIHN